MTKYPIYKLGEICETTSGGTPNRKNDAYYGGSIPWVKSGELGKGVIFDTEEKITEEAVKESSAKIFPKGTLLIALYGATIGKLGFLGVPAATNQAVCGIFENEKIDLQFLSYYLFHKRNDLIAQGTGGAQPNISQTILKNLPIPLPPLSTQHQIVSRIESLFAELDKAAEHLRTAQQQLKTYRQAVLNHWLNNEDGKWETVNLGEVAEIKRGRSKHRPRNDKSLFGGKYPFIQTGEIREANGGTITTFSQTYSEKGLAQSRLWPKGTLCLTIAANIAETAYLGFDACFPDSVVGILAQKDKLNLEYFNLFIQLIKQEIENKASATAQKNINVDFLENLEVSLPPLPEQQRIVQEIESRLSQAEAAEARIAESLQKTEALRQSILKKAFSGELVVSTSSTTSKGG